MPYVGRGLTTGAQYQKLDAIAINNATTFTMSVGSANVSPDQNHLILVVNGVIQEPGTGFTVAGSTCTLASAITTSGHSGTDTIYGVIAGDAAFAAYDSIGANALGVTAGTVTASRAIVPDSNKDIASFRNVTLTGELDAATLDISGNADIDGTTNLDAVDIDGAVQVDNTITVGANDQGYDVKFFGDTASAYMLWDTSADDLVFAGAAGIDLAGDIDVDGTANLDVVDIDGAVDMASTLTLAGNADFNGDLDVDGTTNLDVVDIDGAVDMASTLAVGDAVTINTSNSEQLMFKGATSPYLRFYESTTAKAYIQWHSDGYLNLENSEASTNLAVGANGVGIGTTSPDGTLHVHTATAGSVTAPSTADDLVIEGSTTPGVSILMPNNGVGRYGFGVVEDNDRAYMSYSHDAEKMFFGVGGADRMTITAGNVGIGTTSPDSLMELSATSTTTLKITTTDGTAGQLLFERATGQSSGSKGIKVTSAGMSFIHSGDDFSSTTTQMLINASGNVGIGEAASEGAESLLHVRGASAGANLDVIRIDNDAGNTSTEAGILFETGQLSMARISAMNEGSDLGALKFWTSGSSNTPSERVRIPSVGGIAIVGDFHDSATADESNYQISFGGDAVTSPRWGFRVATSSADEDLYLDRNLSGTPAVCMAWDKVNGNVGIGNSAPDRKLVVEGNAASDYVASFRNAGGVDNRYGLIIYAGHNDGTGTTDYISCQDGNGTQVGYIRNTSGTFALTDVSDKRLKENIRDTEVKGLDAVSSMKVRDFEWKKSGDTCIGGFIAQELESAFAPAVTGEDGALKEDGTIEPMGVSRDVLVPVLVKAIQELTAKVEALENA